MLVEKPPAMIQLSSQPINVQAVLQTVASAEAGGVVLFLGTVRATTGEKSVAYLEYECYPEMAQKVLHYLVHQAKERWNLLGCSIVHRLGKVEVGQLSVAIACSAAHRGPAFEATRWLIEQLKHQVPIWKKEYFRDGTSQWVTGPQAPAPIPPASGDSA